MTVATGTTILDVRGLNAFYGLIAIFPVMAIPLLLGGVTAGEFWRISLALANTLFFSLALGLLVSAWSREDRRAMGYTCLLLLLTNVILPGFSIIGRRTGSLVSANAVGWSSPVQAFFAAFESNYMTSSANFWRGLLVTHTLSWAFLAVAAWLLPRNWQDRPRRAREPFRVRTVRPASSRAAAARRVRCRAEWLETNPVLWLATSHHGINWPAWGLVLLVGVLTLLFVWLDLSPAVSAFGQFLFWPFQLGLKILVAVQACRLFVEARHSGTLELLLCTPLTAREILRGQWLALRRSLLWPVILLALLLPVPRLLLLGSVGVSGGGSPELAGTLAFSLLQLLGLMYDLVLFALDLGALGWLGMWLALTIKKPQYAVALTLFFVVFLPGLLFCLPKIAVDLFCIFWSRDKLHQELRDRVRRVALPHTAIVPPPRHART